MDEYEGEIRTGGGVRGGFWSVLEDNKILNLQAWNM